MLDPWDLGLMTNGFLSFFKRKMICHENKDPSGQDKPAFEQISLLLTLSIAIADAWTPECV